MKRIILLSLVVLILLWCGCSKPKKDVFRVEKVNGVEHIYNPPLPLKGTVSLELEKIMEIDSSVLGDDKMVFFSTVAKSVNGNTYIGNWNKLKIYAFNNEGKFLTKFLSKGEGPGEIKSGSFTIQPYKDTIWVPGPGKIIRFTLNGNHIDELKLTRRFNDIKIVEDNLFVGKYFGVDEKETDKSKQKKYICALFDRNGTILKSYFSAGDIEFTEMFPTINNKPTRFVFVIESITPKMLYRVNRAKKEVYICISNQYKIYVKDLDGKLIKVIHGNHHGVSLTDSDREHIVSNFYFGRRVSAREIIWDNLPPIMCVISKFQVLKSGYIAVFRIVGLHKSTVDIFDPAGRYIYQLKFPGIKPNSRIFFDGDKALILTILEKEEKSLYEEYKIKNLSEIFYN